MLTYRVGFPARIVLVRGFAIYLPIKILLSLLRIETTVGMVLLVSVLGIVDIHRRHERALWANLGIGLTHLGILFGVITVMLEIVAGFALSMAVPLLSARR